MESDSSLCESDQTSEDKESEIPNNQIKIARSDSPLRLSRKSR